MKPKRNLKMGIDCLMTALLLCLMGYQITGQALHEWLGTGMLVLFIAHNILNIRWYGNLFKGKYRLLRIVQTIVNFGVLISPKKLENFRLTRSKRKEPTPLELVDLKNTVLAQYSFVIRRNNKGF